MVNDVLDPSALVSALPTLLAINNARLKSPHDAIAALLHSALIALNFRLVAVDDSTPAIANLNGVFPEGWNQHGPGNYTFRYRHEQSSLEFIVKIAKLGSRTLVNAIAVEVRQLHHSCSHILNTSDQSDKAATLDISTDDYSSPSFFPYDASASDAQPLVHGFISSNRIADLMAQFNLKIVQKLMPGLRKEGYSEDPGEASSSTGAVPARTDNPPARPRTEEPPFAPDRQFDRPYRIPTANPLEIGRRDLDPLAANPFAPPSLFPSHGGDGMFVGPDHPMFGQGRYGNGPMPLRGPWGGDGFLPPMGAPPGARFDPVGPGPFPRRGGFGTRGGLPGAGNLRGPDNDEFMPPGAVSGLPLL